MPRWSALKSFLIGAIPTALVFGVIAFALQPAATSPEPEERAKPLSRVPLLAQPQTELSIERTELDQDELSEGEPIVSDELSWGDVTRLALVDQSTLAGGGDEIATDAGASELEQAEPLEAAEPEVAELEEEEAETTEPVASGPICGPVTCPRDFSCCNASCGICTRPGDKCSQTVCGMPMTPDSVGCGPTTCNVGELCCDPACGQCIAPGEPCVPGQCLSPIVTPFSESCGMQTCNTGYVCCNPSCGICARPGEPCRQTPC